MATSINFPSIVKASFPLDEAYQDSTIRTAYENGQEQTRSRYTRRLKKWPSVNWIRMSDTDHATLMTFYDATTDGGALSFNWTHPYTGVVKEVRFGGPPKEKLVGPNYWQIEIVLTEV